MEGQFCWQHAPPSTILHATSNSKAEFAWKPCRVIIWVGHRDDTPHILDFGTKWRWIVGFTLWPLYPQIKTFWYPLDRRLDRPPSGLHVVMMRGIPDLTGNQTRSVHSIFKSLFWLNCLDRFSINFQFSALFGHTPDEWAVTEVLYI